MLNSRQVLVAGFTVAVFAVGVGGLLSNPSYPAGSAGPGGDSAALREQSRSARLAVAAGNTLPTRSVGAEEGEATGADLWAYGPAFPTGPKY